MDHETYERLTCAWRAEIQALQEGDHVAYRRAHQQYRRAEVDWEAQRHGYTPGKVPYDPDY